MDNPPVQSDGQTAQVLQYETHQEQTLRPPRRFIVLAILHLIVALAIISWGCFILVSSGAGGILLQLR
jgi:hypothetical protein